MTTRIIIPHWDADPETGLPIDGGPPSDAVWDVPISSPRPPDVPAETDERRLVELRAMPYREYLETPEWRTVRRAAIKRAEHRCQRCRQIRGRLDVHHLTYERLGCEDYTSDLEVLCRACHSKTHGIPE